MNLLSKAALGAAFLTSLTCHPRPPVATQPGQVYIGTYTRDEGWVHGKGDGIYRAAINGNGASLAMADSTNNIVNPTFLALSPDRKNLYAVSEIMPGDDDTGFVYAFAIEHDQSLRFINRLPSNGLAPAHISVDPTGRLVFASNYVGGVVSVYKRNEDGSISLLQTLQHKGSGPHPNQDGSHVHMAKVSPDHTYLYVPDLGADKIWSYRIDPKSPKLIPTEQGSVNLAPGAGPRHMDFHPGLHLAYVVNELNSTISLFSYSPKDGVLEEIENISTLPNDFKEWNSTADIHVHPNGKFLYASNRGHNSIVIFALDDEGRMSLVGHTPTRGEIPRNFVIHPSGDYLYVANQNTDTIEIFSIDPESGTLSFTGNKLDVPTPVCILFY